MRSDGNDVPRVGIGRNNLTALSQYRNLFFVAYSEEVYVYEPRFPCQSLGKDPTLVIKLPVSRSGLPGHLNPRYPHVINHMVVDDLGDEETLACCCDDGDVVLYHVTAIARVIDLRAEHGPFDARRNGAEDCGGLRAVRPFYHWNVGRSAWGLAMHKAGRMLAVSNNNHVIDVVAFALRHPAPGSSSASSASDDDDKVGLLAADPSTSAVVAPRPRPVGNRHVRLSGHLSNIPSVAFCNDDGHDAKGEWLVSTDIDGVMIVWDIWSREIRARYQFGNEPVAPRGGLNGDWELNRGWAVLCLARNTFRKCDNDQQVYGMKPSGPRKKTMDISRSIDDVEDSSALWPLDDGDNADPGALLFADEGSTAASDDVFMNEMLAQAEQDDADTTFIPPPGADGVDGSGAEDEMDMGVDVNMVDLTESEVLSLTAEVDPYGHGFAGTELEYNDELMSGDDVDGDDDYEDDDGDNDDVDDAEPNGGNAFYVPRTNTVGDDPVVHAAASSHATDGTPTSPATSNGQATTRPGKGPRRKKSPMRFCILHTSEVCVRLLSTPFTGPSVICRGPLAQPIAHESPLARYRRLNMVLHVPELSLVVVGCQAGRVALFTTTLSADDPSCGFRLEHMLPYSSQELAGHRPNLPLLGLAIGPVQGRERAIDGPGKDTTNPARKRKELWRHVETFRRHRLMLTYYDHTVLSYEIGRMGTRIDHHIPELSVR